MLKVIFIGLSCLLTLSVCFPSGFQYVEQKFRSISIKYDPDTTTSGNISYAFDYRLKKRDITANVVVIRTYPNDTISGLRINEELETRVATSINGVTTESDFSPWRTIKVKPSSEVGNVMIPGQVQKIEVVDDWNNKTKSAIVNWEDPQNVQDATQENDKDIQYKVETCRYNKFTEKNTDCKLVANLLKIKDQIKQTTNKKQTFYIFNFHPEKKNEIAYIVTPISLNGTEGPSAQIVKRLDEAEKPDAPTNLTSSDVYANELDLSWKQGNSDDMAYIKYNIKNNVTTTIKENSPPTLRITGLESETEYEFQVGVYSSKYGSSEWSAKYTVKTTNETRPSAPSAGTPLTSSVVLLVSMLTFGLLKLVL